jgi:hypothetical protein
MAMNSYFQVGRPGKTLNRCDFGATGFGASKSTHAWSKGIGKTSFSAHVRSGEHGAPVQNHRLWLEVEILPNLEIAALGVAKQSFEAVVHVLLNVAVE